MSWKRQNNSILITTNISSASAKNKKIANIIIIIFPNKYAENRTEKFSQLTKKHS